ncbi:MAG: YbgC/FadM family acyl-CoA thioesterase [Deltaproteobacteria bacterium]|nr:YbgC/FadM family acyl-CoA thioesterase [Deltaproteobacteria bacterium]
MITQIPLRIYYEDTDVGGVVYYANYLKFFERGRTEFLRSHGVDLSEYHSKGIVFVVVSASVDYFVPAKYGDLLSVETKIEDLSGASILFSHKIFKEGLMKPLVTGQVKLACTKVGGGPVRIPPEIRKVISI